MVPRQINTMQEPMQCAVCGRTLLRGEHPDVFLHAGERRVVCELCTPRAVHEGWIREGADAAPGRARTGWSRRGTGTSFMDRIRARRGEGDPELLVPEEAEGLLEVMDDDYVYEPQPEPEPSEPTLGYEDPPLYREVRSVHAIPTNADMKAVRAIELFNASQHCRTISGVAKTLGAPLVSVRPSLTEGSIVTIVVAWELSWYRFEVDLADEIAGVRATGKGYELDQLDEEDRTPNAIADENGELHAAVQPA